MNNKSQLTLFFILGIVLLLGFFFLVNSKFKSDNIWAEPGSEQSIIDKCLENSAAEAVIRLGFQNGIVLKEYSQYQIYSVNYAYSGNKSSPLSIQEMESQLEEYISKKFKSCVSSYLKLNPLTQEKEFNEITVKINALEVEFLAEYRFSFKRGNSIVNLEKSSLRLPIRLGKIQEIIEHIANNYDGRIPLAYLGEQDLNTTVFLINNDYIYQLTDEKSPISAIPYKYLFALK